MLAWIILWFLTCHTNSKVGCTSITEGNIDTNLWPELYKWMEKSPFLSAMFVWSATHVRRRGKAGAQWFAVKRTWPKTGDAQQQAAALAGIHADDVMFVLDEVGDREMGRDPHGVREPQPVQHGAKQPVVAQTPHPPVRRSR